MGSRQVSPGNQGKARSPLAPRPVFQQCRGPASPGRLLGAALPSAVALILSTVPGTVAKGTSSSGGQGTSEGMGRGETWCYLESRKAEKSLETGSSQGGC